MKSRLSIVLLFLSLILTACSTVLGPPPAIGDTEAEVIARRGNPNARFQLDDGSTLLEYNRIPWGQYTYMARFDATGKMVSYEQVLTVEKFGTIVIGKFNKQDVLHTVGHPTETAFFPLIQMEVWSYRYKENGVWNSMMAIYFDKQGIVQRMENGPDPLFDDSRRGRGRGGRR